MKERQGEENEKRKAKREYRKEEMNIGNLLTYGAEPFLRSCQLCSHSRTSQHFIEPEGSSPCSQEPSR
jgi:hypothetical protein